MYEALAGTPEGVFWVVHDDSDGSGAECGGLKVGMGSMHNVIGMYLEYCCVFGA
jgi:hypothetical protein